MPTPFSFPREVPLVLAHFLARPNRFIAEVRLNGEAVRAHVPDPGRLKELFLPEVEVMIGDYGPSSLRKLRYSLELVKADSGHWVSVNTQLPNRLMKGLLSAGILPWFEGYQLLKSEFRYGESRIDFLLGDVLGKQCLVEVKSCTLVETNPKGERVAKFPDAPTTRGCRHVRELIRARCQDGMACFIVFIIQRSDADWLTPNWQTDPALAQALVEAQQHEVQIKACSFELLPDQSRFIREIPVILKP